MQNLWTYKTNYSFPCSKGNERKGASLSRKLLPPRSSVKRPTNGRNVTGTPRQPGAVLTVDSRTAKNGRQERAVLRRNHPVQTDAAPRFRSPCRGVCMSSHHGGGQEGHAKQRAQHQQKRALRLSIRSRQQKAMPPPVETALTDTPYVHRMFFSRRRGHSDDKTYISTEDNHRLLL